MSCPLEQSLVTRKCLQLLNAPAFWGSESILMFCNDILYIFTPYLPKRQLTILSQCYAIDGLENRMLGMMEVHHLDYRDHLGYRCHPDG